MPSEEAARKKGYRFCNLMAQSLLHAITESWDLPEGWDPKAFGVAGKEVLSFFDSALTGALLLGQQAGIPNSLLAYYTVEKIAGHYARCLKLEAEAAPETQTQEEVG